MSLGLAKCVWEGGRTRAGQKVFDKWTSSK